MATFIARRPFAITSTLKSVPKSTISTRAFHNAFRPSKTSPSTSPLKSFKASRNAFFAPAAFRRTYNTQANYNVNPAAQGSLGQRLLLGGAVVGGALIVSNLMFNSEKREDGGMSAYEKSYLNDTFAHTGLALGIIAVSARQFLTSGLTMRMMSMNPWIVIGGGLAVSLGTMFATRNTHPDNYMQKYALWAAFNVAQAAVLSPIMMMNPAILARAGLYTVAMMGSLTFVGATAKNDKYLYIGGPLVAGFAVVMAAGFAPLLLPATAARTLMWSERLWLYGGLGLFGGLTLYDTQKIMHHGRMAQQGLIPRDPVNESISITLDFINIFVRMVQILGMQQRRR